MERTNLIETQRATRGLDMNQNFCVSKTYTDCLSVLSMLCFCPKQKSTEVIVVQSRILHMITPPMNNVTVTRISTNILCKR